MSVPTGSAIDDNDGSLNGFQYFGLWGLGEPIPQHYGGTAHYSDAPGSKALLFFRGTSITYYADRQAALSIASVSVDGQTADNVNLTSATTQYQQAVWTKNLTDGDHQLVIQHVGAVKTSIMIDFVAMLSNGVPTSAKAGLGALDAADGTRLVDDTDPLLQFSPNNWRVATEGLFFNKSSRLTQIPGASMEFTFNGSAIWYFTDVGADHGNVRICVDEDEDDKCDLASGYAQNPLAQRIIWSKTDLSAGTHTINITHADTAGKYATFDFFKYVQTDGIEPHGKKSTPTGVIVGATIAGLFFLGILYCVFLCWAGPRFRSRGSRSDEDIPPSYTAANQSTRSSTSTRDRRYVDAEREPLPLGQTIPMGYVMPSPSGPYPITMRPPEPNPVDDTPAQRYRDSVRASRVGSGSESMSDSGLGASPQTVNVPPNDLDLGSGLSVENEGPGQRSAPPSYQRH